jgi:flavodoxin
MKKIIALLLAGVLAFSLAACGSESGGETTPGNTSSQAVTDANGQTQSTQTENAGGKKILVVYFSAANTADVDAVSSATPNFNGQGSTEYLANYIHSKVGGDIAKITPVKDYPLSYSDCADAAKAERDRGERPEFQELSVNPEDYDVIFIGYPMWWYTLPMILYTFFDMYDLGGKAIIPFNTHEGSGDGGTYDEIREFEPGANVLEGLAVRGGSADKARKDIDRWLEGLGY